MSYCSLSNVKISDEIENIQLYNNIEDAYEPFTNNNVYNVEKIYGSEKYRVINEVSNKELKKALEKKYKKLDVAIMFNDLAGVKKIYALKTPVKRSSDYSFAYAVSSKNLNIVKFIFEQGEIDINSYYTKECLIIASEIGALDIVKYLVKIGLNPCDFQYYPIIWAKKFGHDEIVQFLEKDIKKKLGKVPEFIDPYEEIIKKRESIGETPKVDIEDTKVDIEVKQKPKKQIKSMDELKQKSSKLLKNKTKTDKDKKPKKQEKKKENPKKVLSLAELKKRSEKLLKK